MPSKQQPPSQKSSALAEPFSRLFVDRAEADWAFDLFRDTVRQLCATAYDPRLAVTLSERSGKLHLHLNFGSWLVVGFRGPGQVPERVDLTLLAQTIAWDERLAGFAFERKEGEPEVRSYSLPLEVVRPLTTSLRQAYETSLDFIADKFQNWKKATHWKQHNPELVEAFFDLERRERLFASGLADFELVYERQYTAFGSDLVLAEEGVGYEVETDKAEAKAKAEITSHKNMDTHEENLLEREKFNKKLSQAFERFKHNFYDRCVVKLRQKRIGQLRDLLSNPDSISAQVFNQEVWNIHNTVTFNGVVVNIFDRDDFDDKVLTQVEEAIDSDDFEVGGNSIWGSGSRVYAPRLVNEDEKTNYIHQALHILNDTKLTPLEKAERIKSIYGFGDNISTGLVMTFHPDQFSLYNREARKILDRLGYGSKVSLEAYQELVRKLRNDLGSQDYLELDWFLYRVNRGAYSDFFNDLDEAVSNDSEPIELVEPYSQIFASFEEAEWAFDLLAETCARLGIEHAADERFAITLVERYGGLSLHFNFCDWLILGFRPPELAQKRVRLPLIVESAPFGKSFIEYEFEQGTDESPIAAYGLPIEKVRGWDTELQTLFAETLTAIAQRFSPTTYARDEAHHQPSLAATIFDKNARLSFLTDPGASPPQLPITNYQSPEPQSTISPSPHLPISNLQPPVSNPPYPLSQLAADTGLPEAELDRWRRAIERKKQIILYGPPGTGKTFVAEKLAQHLVAEGDGFVEFVQFHPAYAYEDFIQGLRPQARPDGGLDYPLVPGRFLEFCERAKTRQGICVLIIDEINRANLARVFGELMVLLEYRDKSLPLAGGGQLTVPDRVRLIGTMNTADRSIALVDHALRRRFAFIALHPNFDILRHFHTQAQTGFAVDKLIDVLTRLNRRIGDPHFEIGITYFLRQELAAEIKDIWQMEIEPYLEEYFFDQPDSVDAFRWEQIGREIVEMQDD